MFKVLDSLLILMYITHRTSVEVCVKKIFFCGLDKKRSIVIYSFSSYVLYFSEKNMAYVKCR